MNKTLLVGFLLRTISIIIVIVMIIVMITIFLMIITLRVSLSSRPKSSNWREQSPSSFAPDNHDDDHQSTDDDDDDDDNDDDNYDDDDDDAYEVDYDDELDLAHALSTWHQGGCIGKALGQFLRAPATYSLSSCHHI